MSVITSEVFAVDQEMGGEYIEVNTDECMDRIAGGLNCGDLLTSTSWQYRGKLS